MTTEPDYNAHCRCYWCHAVKPRSEIIYVDDRPICRYSDCKKEYEHAHLPRPVPRSVGYYDKG